MAQRTTVLCLPAVVLGCLTSLAWEHEGSRANSILLNGQWEYGRGDGSEGAETAAGQRKIQGQPVTLPGPFMPWNQEVANQTRFVWARRDFRVTAAQAESLAVLRWNCIASGATAFINGREVGDNEPTGPFQVIIPAGVLRSGDNQIVLKIRGAAGIRRSRSGNPLIPSGFGPGIPEVTDDVRIDFAENAYLKWVLAIPDLEGSRVRIRATPTGTRQLDDLRILAEVRGWPEGKLIGTGEASARLVPDGDYVVWAIAGDAEEDPPLYEIWANGEKKLDVRIPRRAFVLMESFGARGSGGELRVELKGKDGWLLDGLVIGVEYTFHRSPRGSQGR